MEPVRSFGAPWGKLLYAMTAIGCILLIGVPVMVLVMMQGDEDAPAYLGPMMVFFFPLVLLITALFSVRSFDVHQDSIRVKRLFWHTVLPYQGLESVTVDPEAMKGSIRTMGNGGLFSFSGRYRSRKLGGYRALVTDMKNSVILRYGTHTVVVTPEYPEEFADLIRQFSGAG
jgi:hypothetical protein